MGPGERRSFPSAVTARRVFFAHLVNGDCYRLYRPLDVSGVLAGHDLGSRHCIEIARRIRIAWPEALWSNVDDHVVLVHLRSNEGAAVGQLRSSIIDERPVVGPGTDGPSEGRHTIRLIPPSDKDPESTFLGDPIKGPWGARLRCGRRAGQGCGGPEHASRPTATPTTSLVVKGPALPLWVSLGKSVTDVGLVASDLVQFRHQSVDPHGFSRGPPAAPAVGRSYFRSVLGPDPLDLYRHAFTSLVRRRYFEYPRPPISLISI